MEMEIIFETETGRIRLQRGSSGHDSASNLTNVYMDAVRCVLEDLRNTEGQSRADKEHNQ